MRHRPGQTRCQELKTPLMLKLWASSLVTVVAAGESGVGGRADGGRRWYSGSLPACRAIRSGYVP
jgi:hypothetical protein